MKDNDMDDFDEPEEEVLEEEDEEIKNDSGDDDVYSDLSEGGWISWFCQLEGNEFLVEIDEDYLNNDLNLLGIANLFKNYK
jgi:casein kinase II subunit beta